ncbi:hypothetical protein ACFWIB_15265 [Streptomyces sp. NPDC127051]|uniref:hypothetical protein n=1 Tax=Streptomyces sp. NPDC127051 TaxID=3347119 RepID=UPI00366715F1
MNDPVSVAVQAGDKVLICLAEEPSEEMVDLLSSQIADHFDGVLVAVVGGVKAVVVQRAGGDS